MTFFPSFKVQRGTERGVRGIHRGISHIFTHIRALTHTHTQKVGEYEHMSKDLNRVAYTRRMMEIMANIQKQKEDIGKILADTRIVQKEINGLTGKLDRVFTVTDEQVYKDARKDEARRTAYKLLASLREVCTTVVCGGDTQRLCCVRYFLYTHAEL